MARYTDEKVVESHNESFQNLEKMNLSSRSPIRQFIVIKNQAIADQNDDFSKDFKLCQKGSSTWYCWCYDSTLSGDESKWPMSALPHYQCVRRLIVKSSGKFHFIWCDCGFYDHIGIPCAHLF